MAPASCANQASVTPPAYHRAAAARQHGRPTFICSPRLVFAHVCEGVEL